MRTLRTLIGVILILLGVPALALAGVGWSAQRNAGPDGSFSAELGLVHTDGYAVTVPNVAEVLDRHIGATLLRSDRVRVTVRSATASVLLWLVPTADLPHYLNGVARTELTAVGYSRETQPVQVADFAGTAYPETMIQQPPWTRAPNGQTLEWNRSTDGQASLVFARADGRAGFAASLTVTVYSSWLDEATWISLFAGAATMVAASVVLFWRSRRARIFGLERDQVLEFVDLVADRLSRVRFAERAANPASAGDRVADDRSLGHRWTDNYRPADPWAEPPLAHEETSELVPVPARHQAPEDKSPYPHTAT
jgi:hypothetical protein